MTVLVVDDGSSAASLYRTRLEQAGFKTTTATGTSEAREILPNIAADLIIVDVMLPKLGGLELLQAIRANDRHKNTPILVLSNAYLPELSQRALQAGGNRTLPRSECTVVQLLSASRSLLGVQGEPPEPGSTDELKQFLIETGKAEVASLRQQCQAYLDLKVSEQAEECLQTLYRHVRSLCSRAGLAGCSKIAQLSGAIEALLFDQLFRLKKPMSPSSIRTLFQGMDCLDHLFTIRDMGSTAITKGSVLLVDDDAICNLANQVALQRANYDIATATDAGSAMILINEYTFDLALLDIEMPGMDGIELCKQIRTVSHHQHTPVIFVTRHSDYESRMKTLESGGDDLISKPIAPLELVVKSTILLLSTSKPPIPDTPPRFRKQPKMTPAAMPDPNAGPSGAKDESNGCKAEPRKPADNSKRASALQLALRENLKRLQESLMEETSRLRAVEQQVAESAQRRSQLEKAIEENQSSHAKFDQLVEELQRETKDGPTEDGEKSALEGRRRALMDVSCFVDEQLVHLKRALTEETERCESLERQMAENDQRRSDFEAALNEIQQLQEVFAHEMKRASNPEKLAALESNLSNRQQAEIALQEDLEKTRLEAEALQNRRDIDEQELARRTNELTARTHELQKAKTNIAEEIRRIKEELAAENEHLAALERDTAEHARYRNEIEAALAGNEQTERALQSEIEASKRAKLRGEFEAQLAESKQAHSKLQQELDEARNQLRAREKHNPESALEARSKELEQRIQQLSAALSQETGRREEAERQVDLLSQRTAELVDELIQRRETLGQYERDLQLVQIRLDAETMLRQQLDAAQKEMMGYLQLAENQQEQTRLHHELEQARRQLQADEKVYLDKEARLEECSKVLRTQEGKVSQKLATLSESLATEAELKQHQLEEVRLHQQLEVVQAELESLRQNYVSERERLQAQIGRLQTERADVEQQVKDLTESLTFETKRREAVERMAVDAFRQRRNLEAELAKRQPGPPSLEGEIKPSTDPNPQQKLEDVLQRITRLNVTLQEEIKRREGAEQQATQIGQRRSELESQLGQLRDELNAARERLQAEQAELQVKIKDLEAAQESTEAKRDELVRALEVETQQREEARQRAAAIEQRRTELEAQLPELQQELEASRSSHQALEELLRSRQSKLETELARLREELKASDDQLKAQQETAASEQNNFQKRIEELQARHTELEQQIARLTDTVAQQTRQREEAEQRAAAIEQRRTELEAQLPELQQQLQASRDSHQALEETLRSEQFKLETELARLREELKASDDQLKAQQETAASEQNNFQKRIEELQARHTELEQQIARLTDTVAQQTRQREEAELRAAAIEQRRTELEAQLPELQQQLQASRNSHQVLEETLRSEQSKLETELARLREELKASDDQLKAQQETAASEQNNFQKRIEELQARHTELEQQIARLTDTLAQQTRQREEAELRANESKALCESLQSELTAQLRLQSAREQELRERAAQLESELAISKQQFNNASNQAAILKTNLADRAQRVQELELVQTALCAMIKESTAKQEITAQEAKTLEVGIQENLAALHDRDRQLAALRFAILATAQKHKVIPVEPTNRQVAQFDLAAALEAAFDCAKSQAAQAGIACDCIQTGEVPGSLHGDASSIEQLITRFASSLRELAEVASIRVNATVGQATLDVLPVTLTWSVAQSENDPTLRALVSAIAATSANPQTAQMGTSEAGFAAAWQLAIALDGAPQIVTEESGQWRVEVTLRLPFTSTADPDSSSSPEA